MVSHGSWRVVGCVVALVAASSYALAQGSQVSSEQAVGDLFERTTLADWELLPRERTAPFLAEKLRSTFLWGARSPNGAFIFVSWVPRPVEREAYTLGDLASLVSRETFAHLAPRHFSKATYSVAVKTPAGVEMLEGLEMTIEGDGDGVMLLPGSAVATVRRTLFLPIVMRRGSSVGFEGYRSGMIIADLRARKEDTQALHAFELLLSTAKIAESWQLLTSEGFNRRLLPELRMAKKGLDAGEPPRPTPEPHLSEESDPAKIAQLLRAGLTGEPITTASIDQQLLRRLIDTHFPFALGEVVRELLVELERPAREEFQHQVWLEFVAIKDEALRRELILRFIVGALRADDATALKYALEEATSQGVVTLREVARRCASELDAALLRRSVLVCTPDSQLGSLSLGDLPPEMDALRCSSASFGKHQHQRRKQRRLTDLCTISCVGS